MKVLIQKIITKKIEVSEDQKYCKSSKTCSFLIDSYETYCDFFYEIPLNKKAGKILRCRECLGAQMAAEAEGK